MNEADAQRHAAQIVAWIRSNAPAAADLRIDSREVRRGDVFFAMPGRRDDGRRHMLEAVSRGAGAIVTETLESGAPPSVVPLLQVEQLAPQLSGIGAAFYGDPTARMLVIGVTGTNGKTSCSHWIAQLLTACGRRCGVIGTVGSGFPDALSADASLTTPDALGLQRQARALMDAGAQALAIEVSSIGLDQHRTDAIRFDLALFTNLTRDHLDYHGSMAEYRRAKERLFDTPCLAQAVLNLDDDFGRLLARRCRSRMLRAIGYRVQGPAVEDVEARAPLDDVDLELCAEAVELGTDGLRFDAHLRRAGAPEPAVAVRAPVIGRFNVSNVLGVFGTALAAGVEALDAAAALQRLRPPAGRLQPVELGRQVPAAGLPLVLVDYAHTPDAIDQALAALRPVAQARAGRLWIVFGAGGDRDAGKRPEMGAAAARGADCIVVTSDNPRSEDPTRIVEQIVAGAVGSGVRPERTEDRARAIAGAVARADSRDVVLIAGKGHEQYQEVAGRRLPFSDVECARAALERRAGQAAQAGAG